MPCLPAWSMCQCSCLPAFLRDIVLYVTTCQVRSNFSFLRTNVTNLPSAIRHANVSTWRANVPILELGVPTCMKAYQFFQHVSYEMLKEISMLYYYIKNSLYLTSYLYVSCVCVSCIKIVLYFISTLFMSY